MVTIRELAVLLFMPNCSPHPGPLGYALAKGKSQELLMDSIKLASLIQLSTFNPSNHSVMQVLMSS